MISISILAYLLKHIESIAHHEKIDKHIMLKGEKTGLWTFWHVNGTKFSEGHFDNHGQRIGLWTYWNDNGDIWTYFSIQRVSTDLQKISC